jgi:hypothetical protein
MSLQGTAPEFGHRHSLKPLVVCTISIGIVTLLAFLHLPYPFGTDQALFTHFARAIAGGARLYVDVIDLKQPGIFAIYLFGGYLFGFDEIGIHTFDLLWTLGLAAVILWIAFARLSTIWLVGLAPVLCLGPFYGATWTSELTQTEILICLPIALALGLMIRASPNRRNCVGQTGLAGSLVVLVALVKLVLAVVPLAIIMAAWMRWLVIERTSPQRIFWRAVVPATFAGLLAVAAAVGVLAQLGILDQTISVTFTYPRLVLDEFPWAPYGRLAYGIVWLLSATWALLPLAAIGGIREVFVRRSAFGWTLAAWLLSSSLAILVQRFSWWQYHFIIFFVPIGLLAVAGADACLQWMRTLGVNAGLRSATIAGLCVAVTVPSVWLPISHKVQDLWLAGPSPFLDPVGFTNRADMNMRQLRDSVAFLQQPESLPGSIAVFGDGRIFLLANRPVVLSINGVGPALPPQVERSALAIEQERPAYVYVYPPSWESFAAGSDAVLTVLERDYVEYSHDERDGLWCQRRQQEQDIEGPMQRPPCNARAVAARAHR